MKLLIIPVEPVAESRLVPRDREDLTAELPVQDVRSKVLAEDDVDDEAHAHAEDGDHGQRAIDRPAAEVA